MGGDNLKALSTTSQQTKINPFTTNLIDFMKSTSNRLPNAFITNNELTPIEKHNSQVIAFIKKRPLSLIQQAAIKLFTDSCQREKLSNEAYNKAVTKFNQQHGLLIPKKVIDTINTSKYDTGKYYDYINYPYIDSEAFKLAMQHYRSEIKRYNDGLIDTNNTITNYNKKVEKNLSAALHKKVFIFKKQHQRLFNKTYNKKAEAYNLIHGTIVRKKRIQKVKFQSEIIFSTVLGFYAKQLKQRNAYNLGINLPTSVAKNKLPALKIDYSKLANHKIDGIQRLDICKKTAQNHIKRLREAGIINNYLFINSNTPVKCSISTKILVILDGNVPKSKNAENQLFTDNRENDLHNNSDTTRSLLLNKSKIKDSATSSIDQIRSLASQTVNACAAHKRYTNTQTNNDFSSPPPKNKNEKRSENLRKLLVEPHILAQQLANNAFLNYTPLRYDRLKQENLYGNLSNEEFKQLVIYDILKSSNKLYKNHTVFAGEWTKTIKKALETWFISNDFTLHKATIIKKMPQYRWQLEKTRKFLLKPQNKDFTLLYPYQWFNKSRTLSKECGFFGLAQHYIKNQALKVKNIEQQQLETRENNIRKERLTHLQKAENKVKRYLKGKISMDELYNYVQDNLPHNWLANLPSLIEKINLKNVA